MFMISVVVLAFVIRYLVNKYIWRKTEEEKDKEFNEELNEGCLAWIFSWGFKLAFYGTIAFFILGPIGEFFNNQFDISFLGYKEFLQEGEENAIKEKIAAEQEAKVTERVSSKNIRYKILNYYYAGNNLIITLRVENKSGDPFSIHKISGILKDKNDNRYQGKISLLTLLTNLNPGMYTDISLIFSVPTAQKYDLLLNDSFWGDSITLHLQ